MSLINDVKEICDRLAPRGWRELLLALTNGTLDIAQPGINEFKKALAKSLKHIDRTQSGLEDFHPLANKAITPGRPEQSLLFHVLSSPLIHPTATGAPSAKQSDYPTLEELDVVENYIYSLVANRKDLDNTVIAVFSYQYREGSRSAHLRFADFIYSRTGVARVGTAAPNYNAQRRSFWVLPENNNNGISVLPARYAVFLARRAKPGANGTIQGVQRGDNNRNFLFPVHKLFAGSECLAGCNINIDFLEYHRNEKLRMTHILSEAEGGLPIPEGFDINQYPYVRDSRNGGNLVSLQKSGASALLVPTPAKALIRTAAQKNSVSNKEQIAHFIVPRKRANIRDRETRYMESSLEIPSHGDDRIAPEYVNIRHEIKPLGSIDQKPKNLNTLDAAIFSNLLEKGGYPAAHFVDDSCDGCVEAVVTGLKKARENFPAFSLVTAPDFFPLADQMEVEAAPTISNVEPLSKQRLLPVNPLLPRPSNPATQAFRRDDKTLTAILGSLASGTKTSIPGQPNYKISHLPDAASNVFAPGWDTARSRDAVGSFLSSSGLGSPFPEDAKLCAALASFWPSVAPDNGRTFGNEGFGNQLPMLDEELGFHPAHQHVIAKKIKTYRGWDGEYGPFFETIDNKRYVNYVAIERSDYVAHALAGRIRLDLTAYVQSEDLIARNLAFNASEAVLEASDSDNLCLVSFRKIADWGLANPGSNKLTGDGYLLEFAELTGKRKPTSELDRVRRQVKRIHLCQYSTAGVAYKNGNAAFSFHPH